MRYFIIIVLIQACFLLQVESVYARNMEEVEKWGTELLKPVQVEDERNEFENKERHVFSIEDYRYIKKLNNCSHKIITAIETWGGQVGLVARRQHTSESRVYSEVKIAVPVEGSIIIIYHFFQTKKKAYLKFLFDSNSTISIQQKEQLIYRYNLMKLKSELTRAMDCG